MSTALHLCKTEDAQILSELMQRHALEHGQDPEDPAMAAAVKELLNDCPYGMIYLLGPRRAPVGYICVTLGWSLQFGGLAATIEDLYLRDAVRGRGIRTEVLIALGKMLKAAGAKVLQATLIESQAQIAFEKAGLTTKTNCETLSRVL